MANIYIKFPESGTTMREVSFETLRENIIPGMVSKEYSFYNDMGTEMLIRFSEKTGALKIVDFSSVVEKCSEKLKDSSIDLSSLFSLDSNFSLYILIALYMDYITPETFEKIFINRKTNIKSIILKIKEAENEIDKESSWYPKFFNNFIDKLFGNENKMFSSKEELENPLEGAINKENFRVLCSEFLYNNDINNPNDEDDFSSIFGLTGNSLEIARELNTKKFLNENGEKEEYEQSDAFFNLHFYMNDVFDDVSSLYKQNLEDKSFKKDAGTKKMKTVAGFITNHLFANTVVIEEVVETVKEVVTTVKSVLSNIGKFFWNLGAWIVNTIVDKEIIEKKVYHKVEVHVPVFDDAIREGELAKAGYVKDNIDYINSIKLTFNKNDVEKINLLCNIKSAIAEFMGDMFSTEEKMYDKRSIRSFYKNYIELIKSHLELFINPKIIDLPYSPSIHPQHNAIIQQYLSFEPFFQEAINSMILKAIAKSTAEIPDENFNLESIELSRKDDNEVIYNDINTEYNPVIVLSKSRNSESKKRIGYDPRPDYVIKTFMTSMEPTDEVERIQFSYFASENEDNSEYVEKKIGNEKEYFKKFFSELSAFIKTRHSNKTFDEIADGSNGSDENDNKNWYEETRDILFSKEKDKEGFKEYINQSYFDIISNNTDKSYIYFKGNKNINNLIFSLIEEYLEYVNSSSNENLKFRLSTFKAEANYSDYIYHKFLPALILKNNFHIPMSNYFKYFFYFERRVDPSVYDLL